jgi:glycine cleavage system regulatory protein
MQVPLVMTIIGPDRTGLVESVARVVADHGGNWLESRMCRLGGEFAGILRIELPVEKRQPLLGALQALQSCGLTVVVRPDEAAAAATKSRQTKLEIVGHDRPGIVREITSALARANVNVEEFSSECVSAPMSGETLFKAVARLQLPERCDLAALKTDLEKIAADLLVDVSFAEVSV